MGRPYYNRPTALKAVALSMLSHYQCACQLFTCFCRLWLAKLQQGNKAYRYKLDVYSPVHTSNNVEATFDFVAKTAAMSNEFCVEILFFRQSRTLLQHCC